METMTTAADTSSREIVITRLLSAPRELVWEAWTKQEHIAQWFGPAGFTNTVHEMTVKPGGVWRFMMHGPNDMNFPNRITYIKVEKPSMLAYDHDSDKDDDPEGFHVTISFDEQGDKTLLTMRSIFKSAAVRDMKIEKVRAIEGGNQTLDKLEAYLATMN